MGRTKEARAEYEAALTGVESGVVDPALIQAKIDELSSEVTDLGAGVAADGAATN
jgi:outer membrane murein-binding lipoprotein Lpp